MTNKLTVQARPVDNSIDGGAQVQQTVNFEFVEEYNGTSELCGMPSFNSGTEDEVGRGIAPLLRIDSILPLPDGNNAHYGFFSALLAHEILHGTPEWSHIM